MARRDLTGAVDFAYLEAYAHQDQRVIEEVLDLFREQASLWMRLLDHNADRGAWKDAVHTLKGSARGIGAVGLAQACEVAERGAGGHELRAVRDALDLVLSDIAAYMHEQALRSLRV
jgi:HPt (histidine-containing phosphotransfer) domain-containing protein